MSKILWVFVLIISLFVNPPTTSAILGINEPSTAACSTIGISPPDPNTFYEGNTSITINIKIENQIALDQLKGHYLQAWFGTGIVPGDSQVEKIKSDTYIPIPANATVPYKVSFTTTNSTLLGNGMHSGSLHDDVLVDGSFRERCSQLNIQVGATDGNCKFDPDPKTALPSNLPPNTTIPSIRFLGLANKKYELQRPTKIAEITTNSSGQGSFDNVLMPGNVGDSYRLVIYSPFSNTPSQCEKTIYITADAPKPPTVSPGTGAPIPVTPPTAQIEDKCKDKNSPDYSKNCSKAGGETCSDARGPGFKTAIGCIHTTPKVLVQDVLTFATGIGGGLAFIMMLFGAFQMLTSGGNPQNLQGGRDVFQNAIIGLLFIIFSILLMKIIGIDILSLPGFK